MGYSNNNKWKKILYILMIINLLFILFAKFSKVFASFIDIDNISYNTSTFFDENINTKNYTIFYSSVQNKYLLIACETPIKATLINDTNYHFYTDTSYYYAPGSWTSSLQDIFNTTTYNFNSNTFSRDTDLSNIIFTNHDIKDSNNNIIINNMSFNSPSFDNITEIENGNPDGVFISPGDFTKNDNLYFHLLQIDNSVPNSDTSIYYYTDHTFLLNKNSSYYKTWLDPEIQSFYYYIPRYKLGLSTNTSYLYVLNNSSTQIQNSFGIYTADISNGIYDVIQSDTANVISSTEEQSDRMKNIEETITNNNNSLNNIENTLNDTNISNETNTDINNSLDFDNNNTEVTNINSGFFSRLTSLLSSIGNYNLNEDTTIEIPIPIMFTQFEPDEPGVHINNITLHSNFISSLTHPAFITLIQSFWYFIFTFYLWRFINKIYIAISTGHILDTFNGSNEVITNDML